MRYNCRWALDLPSVIYQNRIPLDFFELPSRNSRAVDDEHETKLENVRDVSLLHPTHIMFFYLI